MKQIVSEDSFNLAWFCVDVNFKINCLVYTLKEVFAFDKLK